MPHTTRQPILYPSWIGGDLNALHATAALETLRSGNVGEGWLSKCPNGSELRWFRWQLPATTAKSEEQDAFALSMELAKADPCDLILLPRCGSRRVAVGIVEVAPAQRQQVGVLLTDFLLANMSPAGGTGGVIVKTIVTTEMVVPIAQKYGVEVTIPSPGSSTLASSWMGCPKRGNALYLRL